MRDIINIKGIIPAVMTCFDAQGKFDSKRQEDLVAFLIEKGVHGLYVGGSSAEAFLMDVQERQQATEATLKFNSNRVSTIVHIGDIGTQNAILLARSAQDAGADAVSSVPPFYFRFTEAEILGYYEELSNSVHLPMVVYNVALAGTMNFSTILKLAKINNVKGIKYTMSTHHEILRIKQELGEQFMVYSGVDEMALSALIFGADGAIGTFYNLIPEIYNTIYQSFHKQDLLTAMRYQRIGTHIILEVLKYPYFSAIKRLMAMAGHDLGYTRKPFEEIGNQQLQELARTLVNIRDRYQLTGVDVLDRLSNKL